MDSGMLNEATSSSDDPVPGYMLMEISKLTLTSYPACQHLEDFLASRLKKNNHNIKYKCLMIIKHVCRKGRLEFKKDMARQVEPIKDCLQFRGPPDPMRGDEIYSRVREMAREALDAIFDSQMPMATSSVAAQGRIQGMGGGEAPMPSKSNKADYFNYAINSMKNVLATDNSQFQSMGKGSGNEDAFRNHRAQFEKNRVNEPSYSSTSYPPQQQRGGPEGFGNPNFSDARNEKSWSTRASEFASSLAEDAAKAVGLVDKDDGVSMGSLPFPPSGGNGDYQFRSNRGPHSAAGSYKNAAPMLPGGRGKAWPKEMQPRMVHEGEGEKGRAGTAASDGAYEQNLIDSLCEPSGLRAVPDKESLVRFLTQAQTLSPDRIGECLVEKLNADEWQSRAKSLHVIGALVNEQECPDHRGWWGDEESIDDLRRVLTDPKAAVRKQAEQVLRMLGRGDVVGSDAPVKSDNRNGNAITPAVNLLGDEYDEANRASSSTTAAVDDLASVFGGVSIPSAATTAPQQGYSGDLLGGDAPPPVPVEPPSETRDFLADTTPASSVAPVSSFSFMAQNTISAQASVQAPAPAPAPLAGNMDLLSPMVAPAPAPSATGAATSFSFMTDQQQPVPTQTQGFNPDLQNNMMGEQKGATMMPQGIWAPQQTHQIGQGSMLSPQGMSQQEAAQRQLAMAAAYKKEPEKKDITSLLSDFKL